MAAAAGKKSTTSLSLFMEAFGLDVEEELPTMSTQTWAEGARIGKWHMEQKEARVRQTFEVQTWRQVRGPAGAVMCETRDVGSRWPQWRTLIFEGQVRVDMRYACLKDVKKMLLKQARSLLRKKTNEDWTAKHRHVARKLVLEGGRVQKRLYDIGWPDESKCQACHKEEGTEKHRLHHCPAMERAQT